MAEPKPARPPGGAVRVALMGNYDGNPWLNRFWLHAVYSSTPSAANLLGLSNAVAAAFRTRFAPQLGTNWHSTTQRTVLYVDADTEIAVDGADTGSGTDAGFALPPQVAYLINWAIAGTYRGGHPRSYLSGATGNYVNPDGTITGAHVTALTTAAGNFLSDVNALSPTGFTSVALGTYRFFRGHAAVNPPVFEPFLAGSCHPRVATQRRRALT